MFRRRKAITISDLPKYLAKGYGQGEGANYIPMLHVQDFPSKGWRNRELGWKTGRQHDYFSNPELYYHYHLDWSKVVSDIREQFPLLPVERTLQIAEHCGIRHPIDPKTKEPIVMTTDFLVVIPRPIGFYKLARTVKPAKYLDKRRTIEKFEIERRYWLSLGIDWRIVTEYEIDMILVENVRWVHKFLHVSSLAPLPEGDVRDIAIKLTQRVRGSKDSLSNVALACDKRLGLEPGQSLVVARHLIASRQWQVDMLKPIRTAGPLELLGASLSLSGRK
jgi:hypothetical protein